MRITDLTGLITVSMGTIIVLFDKVIQAMDHHAPAFGVIIAFLTFLTNLYFQVKRRKQDK